MAKENKKGLSHLLNKEDKYAEDKRDGGRMVRVFGAAPFSILDVKKGTWVKEKKAWQEKINDGVTREGVGKGILKAFNGGTSIFDAKLAEVLVKWYSNEGYEIFDCYAGSTTIGYVAGSANRSFEGIELRQEQCDYNNKASKEFNVNYICDDGLNLDKHFEKNSKDMFITCPPYANLEVYSDDKNDLSNMPIVDFFKLYRQTLIKTYNILKENRFAVVIVGEVRDKKTGNYIGLVPKTIQYMEEAGYNYYNEIILATSIGTLPMRAGRFMNTSRKIGKNHQNILVFYKGNTRNIKEHFNPITE